MGKITLLLLLVSGQIFSQDLNQDLLLNYTFNGSSLDASGNNYDGIPFGMVYGEDRFGNQDSAAYFDGIDDYMNFPNLEALKIPLPVSFCFWIRYEGSTYNEQVVFNTSMEENHATSVVFNAQSGTNKYVINYADGSYFYGSDSRRSYISNSQITTGEWRQIIVVVNSAIDMKIYVNCVENGGDYSGEGGDLSYSLQPGCIGRHDRSMSQPLDYFKGYIDDFRYWGRALSQADIDELCDQEVLQVAEINKNRIDVYPNPVSDILHIETGAISIKSIEMYNTLGQMVCRTKSNSINVSSIAPGIYLVRIESETGVAVRKVIVR